MNKLIALPVAASLLIFSGCQTVTVAENPGYIEKSTIDTTHPRARLVLGSDTLVGNIRMSNLKFRKVGLFTQVQVGIQNLSGVPYHIEYRVEWEDHSGFMVDQSGAWRRLTLAPAQIETFLSTGKKPEAERIVVNLRLPEDPFINNKDRE